MGSSGTACDISHFKNLEGLAGSDESSKFWQLTKHQLDIGNFLTIPCLTNYVTMQCCPYGLGGDPNVCPVVSLYGGSPL